MKTSFFFASFCLFFGLLISISNAQDSTNTADTLKQSVADLQKNPGDDSLREKIIKLAATMNPKPETPDEASRHFVKAATFLKEAKDKSDYQLAVDEYRQALLLAPWWGAAYFNEGVALQFAGQFDPATAAFKLYLLTNPDDAAEVKTRLYSMEAEKELAAKHAADENTKKEQTKKEGETELEGLRAYPETEVSVRAVGRYRGRVLGVGSDSAVVLEFLDLVRRPASDLFVYKTLWEPPSVPPIVVGQNYEATIKGCDLISITVAGQRYANGYAQDNAIYEKGHVEPNPSGHLFWSRGE